MPFRLLVHHKRRLGTFAGGPLAKHRFFSSVNWNELRAGTLILAVTQGRWTDKQAAARTHLQLYL